MSEPPIPLPSDPTVVSTPAPLAAGTPESETTGGVTAAQAAAHFVPEFAASKPISVGPLSRLQVREAAIACRRHNFTRRAVTLWFVLLGALLALAITDHMGNVSATLGILLCGGMAGSVLLYRAKS